MNYKIIKLTDRPELLEEAAGWFNSKWGVPREAYLDSMTESLSGIAVPRWYLAMDGERIIGGCGVIENDFHQRPDLRPNLCALYVEEDFRCKGIAGELMSFVCDDLSRCGIYSLYLLTDHTSFYERYGWKFLDMVKNDDGESESRMYTKEIFLSKFIPDVGSDTFVTDVKIITLIDQIVPGKGCVRMLVMRDNENRYYTTDVTYNQSKNLFFASEGTITIKNGELVCLDYTVQYDPNDMDFFDPSCMGAI